VFMAQWARLFLTICLFSPVFFMVAAPDKSSASINITEEERTWLDQNPDKLAVWFDRKFPPIEFQSEDGSFEGMAADIMRLIEERLEVSFKAVPAREWPVLLESLETGEAPIAPVIVWSPERERYAYFSEPYVDVPVVVITTRDRTESRSLNDFKGLKVAAIKGYVTEGFLRENYSDYLEIVTVENVNEGLRDVSFGVVDAMIENLAVAAHYIEEEKLPNLRVAGNTELSYQLSFAVSKKYPLLFSAMQKAMNNIPEQEIKALQNRWLPIESPGVLSREQVQLIKYTAIFVVVITLFLVMVSLFLRRKLKQKMADLERTRQEVVQSEERYRAIFNNAPIGIFRTTFDGRFVEANPTLARMLGYTSREELIKETRDLARDIYPSPGVRQGLLDALKESPQGVSMDIEFKRRDGTPVYSIINASLQMDEEGNPAYLDGTIEDISKRKQAEQEKERLQSQLLQARKMESVGMLAGGIAHDFNNLLQALKGNIELLDKNMPGDFPEKKRLRVIERSIDRAAQLVRQLLLFSRKAETMRKLLDLNREIKDAADVLERTIPKMIKIRLLLAEGTWPVSADPVQVEQMILNLGSNAADAMPEGGTLTIETSNVSLSEEDYLDLDPGRYVRVTVSDTGCGMDKLTLEHVFDPFFTTKEKGKGTGLGLASVYGIVKAHQGHVVCYSEPGVGTTFKIYWPAVFDQEEEVIDHQPESLVHEGTETILVVDDETDIRELTRDALTPWGYTIKTASSGEQALEIFGREKSSIDLVVLDLNMPGMGGYRCLEEILRINPRAKVIIASGYMGEGQIRKSLDSGAAGYIGKPYQISELTAKVRDILDQGEFKK
ncbi:MAG: response regulator, partial [Desulfonatronovibrio sp.]